MKLNFFERLFILSPIRPLLQRHLEARQLLKMGGAVNGGPVLEIGCGPGGGINLIYDLFGATAVDAFDIDPRMVALARQRHLRRETAHFWTGNVRRIPVVDHSYKALFNFGIIHHVVDWRAALSEIWRVLEPGGRFYCEEILAYYITHPIWGRLMDHPQQDRFDGPVFTEALQQCGFHVREVREMANLYLWVIADKPK
jgi:ubiquinone/menaquinone biosynthesis C-methylase UbiE